MITNADMTIYNRVPDPAAKGGFAYHRAVVKGIHWFTDHKVSLGESGLKSADVYKIRIPGESCAGYLPLAEFQALADKGGHWTVAKGDYFVRGEMGAEIEKPADLSPYDPARVMSWSDNRHGTIPHIRMGGGA